MRSGWPAVGAVCLAAGCSNASAVRTGLADAAIDGEVSCSGVVCDGGTCTQGCLVTLVQSVSPSDIAVGETHAYYTSCDDGGGGAFGVPLAGGAPIALARGQHCPAALALDDENVYVAGLDDGGIVKVPRDGDTPTTIASSGDAPLGVAVDRCNVYWNTQAGALMKAPVDGGAPTLLARCEGICGRPVVHASAVYWADSRRGTIETSTGDGGPPGVVASGFQDVTGMAVTDTDVYVANGYGVVRAPLEGGAPVGVGLPTGAPVGAIAADGASIYFTSWESIWRIGPTDVQPALLAASQGDPNAIALDGTSVYWTNRDQWPAGSCCGQVMKLTPK